MERGIIVNNVYAQGQYIDLTLYFLNLLGALMYLFIYHRGPLFYVRPTS